jgi:hypothetical protein
MGHVRVQIKPATDSCGFLSILLFFFVRIFGHSIDLFKNLSKIGPRIQITQKLPPNDKNLQYLEVFMMDHNVY